MIIINSLLLLILILWLGYNIYQNSNRREIVVEGYSNGKYYYEKCPEKQVSTLLSEVFTKHGIFNSIDHDQDHDIDEYFSIYLPCGYTNVEQELKNQHKNIHHKSQKQNQKKIYFGIPGCDNIVSKDRLWEIINSKTNLEYATKLMPETYIISNSGDMQRFIKNYDQKSVYILKKNIQRQSGLKLLNNLDEILDTIKGDRGYVILQKMLQDPFLIKGHKINIRIYLLIVCKNGQPTAYIYNDGFMYYTPKSYANTVDPSQNITTGYIDRKIYDKNPLTLHDLIRYLPNSDAIILNRNIKELLRNITYLVKDKLVQRGEYKDSTMFQLFGVDIAPDKNLDCKLIEINKGPDLSAKSSRDRKLKYGLIEDIFKVLGVIETDRKCEFIEL